MRYAAAPPRRLHAGGSSSGRTTGSGPVSGGSNPPPPASHSTSVMTLRLVSFRGHTADDVIAGGRAVSDDDFFRYFVSSRPRLWRIPLGRPNGLAVPVDASLMPLVAGRDTRLVSAFRVDHTLRWQCSRSCLASLCCGDTTLEAPALSHQVISGEVGLHCRSGPLHVQNVACLRNFMTG